MEKEPQKQGQIITFYSYKGGTGRTMALANVACILAAQQSDNGGKGVLMIDWDLEAPGLHRYFHDKLASRKRFSKWSSSSSSDENYDGELGLIDLFYELSAKTDEVEANRTKSTSPQRSTLSSEEAARQIVESVDFEQYVIPTTVSGLNLLKAGRFNPDDTNEYSERVNKFNWEALYQKSPHLMRVFAETLAGKYAYVLIDSRTGITDVSGICTMLLPEKLVVVFTPNSQSLRGVVDLVRRATDYRSESSDLRPLVVFPLVSRVEPAEPELRQDWRGGNEERRITGYQPEFEKVLAEVYRKEKISLDKYFDEMQIQHIPKYAYGEEIAVLTEKSKDKFSLSRSYDTFANLLIDARFPWEGEIKTSDYVSEKSFFDLYAKWYKKLSNPFITSTLLAVISLSVAIYSIFSVYFEFKQTNQIQQANTELQQSVNQLQQELSNSKDEQVNILKNNNNLLQQYNDAQNQLKQCQVTLQKFTPTAR